MSGKRELQPARTVLTPDQAERCNAFGGQFGSHPLPPARE